MRGPPPSPSPLPPFYLPGVPPPPPPPFYTGANAQAVESAVTTPLEQAINGVEGMTYITSSSTNSGLSTITVTFDIGRDPDLAAVDVQNRVNQALGRMPAEVRTNGITVTKNTAGFMGGLGFYSEDNRYDSPVHQQLPRRLRARRAQARARRRQRDHLRRAQVRDAAVARSAKLARAPDSRPATSSARCASRTSRSRRARSATRRPPRPDVQISVRAAGRLTEPDQFENVVVKAGATARSCA